MAGYFPHTCTHTGDNVHDCFCTIDHDHSHAEFLDMVEKEN